MEYYILCLTGERWEELPLATALLCTWIPDRVCTDVPEFETTHNLLFSDFQEASFIKRACMEKKSINLC